MARPLKNNLDWYRHDTNARTDLKLARMIARHGLEGYGFFFLMLELIYATNDQVLAIGDDETRDLIAHELRIDREKFDNLLDSALDCGLFNRETYRSEGILTSEAIRDRAASLREHRERTRAHRSGEGKRTAQTQVSDAQTQVSDAQTEVCAARVERSREENTPLPPKGGGRSKSQSSRKGDDRELENLLAWTDSLREPIDHEFIRWQHAQFQESDWKLEGRLIASPRGLIERRWNEAISSRRNWRPDAIGYLRRADNLAETRRIKELEDEGRIEEANALRRKQLGNG